MNILMTQSDNKSSPNIIGKSTKIDHSTRNFINSKRIPKSPYLITFENEKDIKRLDNKELKYLKTLFH